MSQRLALTLALLAALAGLGLAVRLATSYRRQRRIRDLSLQPTPAHMPRIIAFSGPGCAACRTQRRILDAALAEWSGPVEVAYVDAVEEPELARRVGVVVVPTTVVAAADGRVVGVTGGIVEVDRLLAQLSAAAS